MESTSLILLDTQSVIWLSKQRELLSKTAIEAIVESRKAGTGLAISDITFWEFAMATTRNRIGLAIPLSAALRQIASVYTILPITPTIAETSVAFSAQFPRDPADRLIAATAVVHGIPLVTSDSRIRESGEVPCIW